MSSPEWWSGCAQKTPRTLLAHREAPALGRALRIPPGTSGSCSRTATSQHCCSRWGSWRGCRGWRRRSPDRTSWRSRLTTLLPPRPFSGQNHPSWPRICRNDPNLTPKIAQFFLHPRAASALPAGSSAWQSFPRLVVPRCVFRGIVVVLYILLLTLSHF